MPVVLLERIPLPSLRTYTSISVLLTACAIYYAHLTVTDPVLHFDQTTSDSQPENTDPVAAFIQSVGDVNQTSANVTSFNQTAVQQPDQGQTPAPKSDHYNSEDGYVYEVVSVLRHECIWVGFLHFSFT